MNINRTSQTTHFIPIFLQIEIKTMQEIANIINDKAYISKKVRVSDTTHQLLQGILDQIGGE
jgi:hypothetical protein